MRIFGIYVAVRHGTYSVLNQAHTPPHALSQAIPHALFSSSCLLVSRAVSSCHISWLLLLVAVLVLLDPYTLCRKITRTYVSIVRRKSTHAHTHRGKNEHQPCGCTIFFIEQYSVASYCIILHHFALGYLRRDVSGLTRRTLPEQPSKH